MQYHSYAFSKIENEPTIVSKTEPKIIPNNVELSTIDIEEIKIFYNCTGDHFEDYFDLYL